MDLLDKCRQFDLALQSAMARKRFFYSRAISPAAAPLTTRDGRELINLGSNNYLPRNWRLTIDNWQLAIGNSYSTLAGENDFIFSDELNHASIIDGCLRSPAKTVVYRHNDMADLEAKLKETPAQAARLVVTDGVFSMEGDICDLPDLRRLADTYDCRLMVDDAHATGVLGRTGRGTAEHFDMEGKVDVTSGTLSKSLAAVGGFTGAPRAVTDFLRYNARQSVFSASLPPPVAATVIAALDVLKSEPERVERLRSNARFMSRELKAAGFALPDHGTPILPIAVGDDDRAYQAAGRLELEDVFANPVVFPAVPSGQAIIRVSLMATHTEDQLRRAVEKFTLVGKELHII